MPQLTDYWDTSLTLQAEDTVATISAREVERLRRDLAVAKMVLAHPRRMGGEVSPEDLKKDKKTARKVAHIFEQSLEGWRAPLNAVDVTPDMKVEAAQMNWRSWIESRINYCDTMLRYVSTWALSRDQDVSWARAVVNRLEKESSWLARSLE